MACSAAVQLAASRLAEYIYVLCFQPYDSLYHDSFRVLRPITGRGFIPSGDSTLFQAFHFAILWILSHICISNFLVTLVLFLPLLWLACDKVSGNLEQLDDFGRAFMAGWQGSGLGFGWLPPPGALVSRTEGQVRAQRL